MLIVCSGPDTYHARKKAQELVAAFRQKHDPTGYSTEILQNTNVVDLLNRLGAPSLFAQKRLIRSDGLLADLKIADVRSLAKRLEVDHEQTIVLTVEDEPLSSKQEKEFEKIKLVQYLYPLLSGARLLSAIQTRARELSVSDNHAIRIARHTDGDMWLAEAELQKCSANPGAALGEAETGEGGIFDASEAFIAMKPGWRSNIATMDESGSIPSVFLSQARTGMRVEDGETIGIHPYAAKKFSSLRLPKGRFASALLRALCVMVASRTGLATTGEEDILF